MTKSKLPPSIQSLPSPARSLTKWAEDATGEKCLLAPLAGDGGSRRYFRLPGKGLLLLSGPNKDENLAWLRIGRHLWFQGLPLPRIYKSDCNNGIFLLQDLGDHQLADITEPDCGFYLSAAELLARLHRDGHVNFNHSWCFQTRRYNAKMAENQEIGYYLNSLVYRYCKCDKIDKRVWAEAKKLARLAASTSSDPVLMHRDFQGRNLIIKDRDIYIIDWQGARMGPAAYDLASLLEETPGCALKDSFKEEVIKNYIKARGHGPWRKTFRKELVIVGAVRLMQALGAYSKLTLAGKKKFKQLIPQTHQSLCKRFEHPLLAPFPALRHTVEEAFSKI